MRIVMDDAGDVPAELVEKHDITIIPVNVMFGTEEYLSGVTLKKDKFYTKTQTVSDENFPKTSQPTPYQYMELFRKYMAEGETEFLVITVSEKLSGTYASVVQAQKEMGDAITIHLFDSKGGSAAQGYMVLEAATMLESGADIAAVLARLEKIRSEMVVFFMIDSLEYAVKGGRVSSMKSAMASLLNIKPIMQLTDGLIVEAGRVRTRKRAIPHIVKEVKAGVGDRPVRLAVIHANQPEMAAKLRTEAESALNIAELITVDMCIPVAINLGPGALGLVAVPLAT